MSVVMARKMDLARPAFKRALLKRYAAAPVWRSGALM
jgi:hypothetical protein